MEMTIDQLIKSAEAGDRESQYDLAYKYRYGKGVTQDLESAVFWFKKAAAQGHVDAIYMVGLAYQGGKGVTKDTVEAIRYFYKAALGGSISGALYNLMAHYINAEVPQEYQPACLNCFLKFSNIDWVQSALGDIYKKGIGVEKNDAEAVRWYSKSAEQGYKFAIYELGLCYEEGRGVQKDISKAMNLYEIAAKGDLRAAKIKLGLVIDTSSVPSDLSVNELSFRGDNYFYGRCGYAQSYSEAIKYYCKAAEKGDAISQNDLGNCYYNGSGCVPNKYEAMKWFNKAATQGYMYGQYNLAWGYEHGDGAEKDLAMAAKLYKQAAEQGHPQAAKRLELLES